MTSVDDAAAGRAAIEKAFAGYKKQFPDVQDISAAELNTLMQDQTGSAKPEVVDVRMPEEQQVSMLPGAITQQDFKQQLDALDKDALIVTYCTAGLRSGKYAAELQRQGFRNVRNLHGSLVSWAHEGLPLVGPDGQPVKRLHAYGQQWADMAKGSGYETVVHQAPLLRGVMDTVTSVFRR